MGGKSSCADVLDSACWAEQELHALLQPNEAWSFSFRRQLENIKRDC